MRIIDKITDGIMRLRQAGIDVSRAVYSRKGKRAYEAGRVTRFTSDWIPTVNAINYDIRNSIVRVRGRSRDLRQNNPYANGYRIASRTNIVGHEGFKLQCKVKTKNGDYNDELNSMLEDMFEEWCESEYCTMMGRYHFIQVQWMVLEQLKFDGEFIVRKVENIDPSVNKFGFSLELLDPEDLDETYSAELPNGNVVIMGVEVDQWRRYQRFYFRNRRIQDDTFGMGGYGTAGDKHNIVEADQLIYGFDPEHPKQLRGMTKLSAVMISLKGVDRWEDASLVNSTLAAQKMGFLEETKPDAEAYTGSNRNNKAAGKTGEDIDIDGGKYADFEAGIIEELPYGKKFSGFDPRFPHEQHQPFLKSMLRKIATGLGIDYNSWANDLEGVNYSSMRSGLQSARDNWKVDQTMFRIQFLTPVWNALLKSALKTKAVDLSYSLYPKIKVHKWQPRTWGWVDPKADVEAKIMAIRAGLESPIKVISEMGYDPEDVYKEFAQARRLQEKYGLSFDYSLSNNSSKQSENSGERSAEDDNTPATNIVKLNVG